MEGYDASCYTIPMTPQYVPLSDIPIAAEHVVSHNEQESGLIIISSCTKLLYLISCSPLTQRRRVLQAWSSC